MDHTPQALRCLEGNHIISTPQALWCLEGTTMSNRGQRPRIHGAPRCLCLEGSTPEDRFTFISTTDSGERKEIKMFLRSLEASRLGPSVIGLCSRRVLAAALCRNSQSCLAGPSKPTENKIAADGSKKRLPWSHNDILCLVIGSAPILWRTALQAEYHIGDYPGTPPPSVYQVTHGTALQAAERYVQPRVL